MDYRAIQNLATMFFDRAAGLGDKPFLWVKQDGAYRATSYSEAAAIVGRLSRGLRALGIGAGDRVMLVSENRPEWVMADLAIMAAGAVSVPAYTTNTTDDHRHILDHSGARAVIVSTRRLLDRVWPAAVDAEACGHVITIEPMQSPMPDGARFLTWEEVLTRGDSRPDDAAETAAAVARGATACFIYTSGTGGRPKGVMLSHGAILANCAGAHDLLLELGLSDEVFLSLLPLSHAYEHTAGLFFPISLGAQIYYAEGPETVAANLAEARPTIMTAVPRLYEVLHQRIRTGVDRAGGLRAKLFHRAVALGRRRYRDGGLGPLAALEDRLLDRLVRAKVAQRFGGRLKTFVSGGAALNPDIGEFFLALGVTILQGYGQTEAAPVISCNRPGGIRIDTVGPPVAGVEARIADDGEILVRGELLMQGYWRDPAATAEVIVDGWLHTGDIGLIDDQGRLQITDRKKDIIVNSGGDNIAPARIEGQLTIEPEIAQAMVDGDRRPWLVAVLVPDEAFLREWAAANGREPDLAALAGDAEFRKAMDAVVARVNARLSAVETVRRFTLAEAPFTTENAMMTPTLKVRRHMVRARYGESLDQLYGRA